MLSKYSNSLSILNDDLSELLYLSTVKQLEDDLLILSYSIYIHFTYS